MNLTLPDISSFTNSSQQYEYKVDGSTTQCVLLIGPLMKLFNGYIYHSVSQAGGTLLVALRSHAYDFTKSEFINEWMKKSYMELLAGYSFIIAAILAFLVYPLFLWRKCCIRHSIAMAQNQGCFCMEGLMFIIASVALFFGAVSSLQVAIHVDEAMLSQPTLASDIFDDLIAYRNNLRLNLVVLKNDHDAMLDFVLESVKNIPQNVTALANDVMSPVIPITEELFNNMHKAYTTALWKSGVASKDGHYDAVQGTSLANTLPGMEAEVRAVRVALETLAVLIILDEQLGGDERQNFAVAVTKIKNKCVLSFDRSKIPKWNETLRLLNETISSLLPLANNSIHFLETMSSDMEAYLGPVVLDQLVEKVRQLKAWSGQCVHDYTAVTESLAPTQEVEWLRRKIADVSFRLRWLDITSSSGHTVFSGRALLVMMPTLHSLLVLMVTGIGGIIGLFEVKKLHQVGSKTLLNSGESLGAKIMRMGTLVALTFLWVDLLIAGVGYLVTMMTATTCLPVLDLTIFTHYMDDPEVWDGKTWVETRLENFTDDKNLTRGVKMQDILQSCSEDDTAFHAVTHGKKWNLEEMFKTNDLKIQELDLLKVVFNAIQKIQLPNYFKNIKYINDNLDEIRRHLEYNFTYMIKVEVERFKNSSLNEHLRALALSLPRDPKYDYIQESLHKVIAEVQRIEELSLPHAVQLFRQLLPLRDAVDAAKLALTNTTLSLVNVYPLMTNSFLPKVGIYVNLVTRITNNFMKSFVREALRKITTKMGNCRVIFNLFLKARWSLCDQGVTLLNAIWISHGIMGVTMLLLILLSLRTAAYFRGAHKSHATWKSRLEMKKLELEQGIASDQAIMVNNRGEMLGQAVVMRGHRNRYAIREILFSTQIKSRCVPSTARSL